MSHYKLRHLYCLGNIDPTHFGRCNHLVSEVQCRGIWRNYGYTSTTDVSKRREIENKRKYWKRKIDVEKSIVTRNTAPKKALIAKYPIFCFNSKYSLLKLVCTLARLCEITLLQPLRLNFYGIKFPSHPCSQFSFLTFCRQDNTTRGKAHIYHEFSPLPNLTTPETYRPTPRLTYPPPS